MLWDKQEKRKGGSKCGHGQKIAWTKAQRDKARDTSEEPTEHNMAGFTGLWEMGGDGAQRAAGTRL